MIAVVVDRVNGRNRPAMLVERLSRIRIDIKAREIAARNINANSMPFFEDVGSGIKFDGERINSSWLHQLFLFERIAEPGAHDPVFEI